MSTVTERGTSKGEARSQREPAEGLLAGGRRSATGRQRPRNRSWGLVTLAALLVVGLGLAVAAWGLHVGQKESVLAIGAAGGQGSGDRAG